MEKLLVFLLLFSSSAYAGVNVLPLANGIASSGSFTSGHCAQFANTGNSGGLISDTGSACGGGGGAPGGNPNQVQYNNAGNFGGFTFSGDCTLVVGTGVITCTATNGSAFGSLATLNAAPAGTLTGTTLNSTVVTSSLTSAAGGSFGTLAYSSAALPATIASASHQWLNSYNAGTGVFTQTQPATTDLSDISTFNLSTSGTAATAAHTITSASANSLAVGPNGSTTPIFNVDSSTASAVDGINIKGAVTGGTVALTCTDASNCSLQNGAKGTGTWEVIAGGSNVFTISSTGISTFLPDAAASGSATKLVYTQPNDAGLTANTEAKAVLFNGLANTVTHATSSNLVTQRFAVFAAPTYAFAAASTMTDAAALGFSLPGCGTNATCTDLNGIYHASTALTVTGPTTNSYIINVAADTGASNNYAINAVGSSLFSGGSGIEVGAPTGALKGSGTINATGVYQNGTQVISTPGTGLAASGATLNSNAVYQVSYQPGLLSAVNSNIGVYSKVGKTATVDNIEGSAVTFTCAANPTITMYECGTSATCTSSPTTIGSVTLTAGATAFDGTINSAAITAGDYIGFAFTAGTCASIDVAVTAQIHSN